ncbi:MAG: hypothetical protein JKY37_34220 [Nannocystaceae bacterium]|nr:hypothetical protein [Nannocystaceae bacterium]
MTGKRTRLLLIGTLALTALAQIACDPMVGPDYKGEPLAVVSGNVGGTTSSTDPSIAVLWFAASEELECEGPALSCSMSGGGGPESDFACIETCGGVGFFDEIDCSDEEALVAWVDCIEGCGGEAEFSTTWGACVDSVIGEMVPVTGQFPAAFELALFQPPPEQAMLVSEDAPNVALGFLIAADPEAGPVEFSEQQEVIPAGVLGISETHMLMYTDGSIEAGSPWGEILGGAYEPGYHVLGVVDGGKDCEFGTPNGPDDCALNSDTLHPAPANLETSVSLTLGSLEDLDWPAVGDG